MPTQMKTRPNTARGHPDYDRRDLLAFCQLLSVAARCMSDLNAGTEMIVYDTQAVFYRTLTWALFACLGAVIVALLSRGGL